MNFDLNPSEAMHWAIQCGMRNIEMDIPWIDEKLVELVRSCHAFGDAAYWRLPVEMRTAVRPDEAE